MSNCENAMSLDYHLSMTRKYYFFVKMSEASFIIFHKFFNIVFHIRVRLRSKNDMQPLLIHYFTSYQLKSFPYIYGTDY